MSERILLNDIVEDPAIQPRSKINVKMVIDYCASMKTGTQFPAIDVFKNGDKPPYYVADGYHRLRAARKAGFDSILAEVHQGDIRAAALFAVGTNVSHGLRRTNDDKKRAVQRLLDDPEWSVWNNVKIADTCGTSEHLVRRLRGLSSPGAMIPVVRKVNRQGKTFDQNTANIGKSQNLPMQTEPDTASPKGLAPEPVGQPAAALLPMTGKPGETPVARSTFEEPVSLEKRGPEVNISQGETTIPGKSDHGTPLVVVGTLLEDPQKPIKGETNKPGAGGNAPDRLLIQQLIVKAQGSKSTAEQNALAEKFVLECLLPDQNETINHTLKKRFSTHLAALRFCVYFFAMFGSRALP